MCLCFYVYRSGGAHKVQLKVVFLILKYYLGLALCIDSYVDGFFFAPPVETILKLYFVNYLELCVLLLRYYFRTCWKYRFLRIDNCWRFPVQ
jgi:hypothetical protein